MPAIKRISQLDLNLLKVLEALYQHQNMTKAAEQLNITPSAVSHAVKRLREVLEDPLFVRQGSGLVATPVCRRLVPDVLTLLGQLRQTLQSFGEFEPSTVRQTIRLAIHEALEPLFFPALLALFAREAPMMNFQSVKLSREMLASQLESGVVDYAIDVARPLSAPIEHECLAKSNFCVLGAKQFFQRKKMTKEFYGESRHLTVSNRPTGKVLEDFAFAQLGFNRDIAVRCQNYQTATAILLQQPLLLTLPESMAAVIKSDLLRVMKLPFPVPAVETHLYWHAQSQTDSVLHWVGRTLAAHFKR